MTRVKQLFRYAGSKAKLIPMYTPFFEGLQPQHCVDYFGGSGTMSCWFHQLYPDAKLYLNDKDQAIYKLFKCIKENYEEFCQELQGLEEEMRSEDGLERMKERYYILRDECYNQTQEPSQEWIQADFEAHPEDYDDINLKDVERWARCSLEGLSQRESDNIIYEYLNGFTLVEWEEMSGQNMPLEHAFYFLLRKLSYSGWNQRTAKGEYITPAGIVRRNATYRKNTH